MPMMRTADARPVRNLQYSEVHKDTCAKALYLLRHMTKADVGGESAIFETLCVLGLCEVVEGNANWVEDSGGWEALMVGSIVGSCNRCDFFFVIADGTCRPFGSATGAPLS